MRVGRWGGGKQGGGGGGVGIIVGYTCTCMWRLFQKVGVHFYLGHPRVAILQKIGHYFVATSMAKKSTLDFRSVTEIN